MTVAELIAELQKLPPDLDVYRYTDWLCMEVNVAGNSPGSPDGKPCVTLY